MTTGRPSDEAIDVAIDRYLESVNARRARFGFEPIPRPTREEFMGMFTGALLAADVQQEMEQGVGMPVEMRLPDEPF